MTFYLRKSIKAGPFRVNLSKSGIGVSAGIPGLRVGVGPRGSYVRMGAGGIFYSSTSGSGRRSPSAVPPSPAFGSGSPGDVVLSDVRGATSIDMLPAQPSELVNQLNAAAKAVLVWPWLLGLTLILAVAVTPWLLLPGVVASVWLRWRDKVRRTVVLFYEVEGPQQAGYQRLVDTFERARQAKAAWHIVASGAVRTTYQYKVNAGATSIENRIPLTRSLNPKPHISANIAIPTLSAGGRSVYFLPDRVLIKDGKTYVDVAYPALRWSCHVERFIESGTVPSDAEVVGWTWKYVNKNGGPDRRFKNNQKLPVMAYGRIVLQSAGGLNVIWSFSWVDSARALSHALAGMAGAKNW